MEVSTTHQLDPRSKLMILLILNGMASFAQPLWLELACLLLLALCMAYQRQYQAAIKYAAGYTIVYLFAFLVSLAGGYTAVTVAAFLAFLRKVVPIFMGAKLLIDSGTGRVVCALQKLHFPKTLIVGLTVALRFFPTIAEEFRSIRDAMRVRGIPFTLHNCVCHPAATTEFVLVPMISRLSIVSDELSAAALTRGIDRAEKRTSYHDLKIRFVDVLAFALFLMLLALTVAWGR